jgi:hypothetical protein
MHRRTFLAGAISALFVPASAVERAEEAVSSLQSSLVPVDLGTSDFTLTCYSKVESSSGFDNVAAVRKNGEVFAYVNGVQVDPRTSKHRALFNSLIV